ncbi:unnamed protein product, partial [marine sediment metagenome]
DCVDRGIPFDDILNIVTKNKTNPVRNLIFPLDKLPMPDRDLIFSQTFHKKSSKKAFFSSRGCPYSCSYCCNNIYHRLYKGKGRFVRKFSVDRLINEINDVSSKYRMDFVKFTDDCFVMKDDSWLREFSWRYKHEVDVPFNCYLRIDTITDSMLRLLKKAGCHSL